MKESKKKALSAALAAALTIGVMPVAAFAANVQEPSLPEGNASAGIVENAAVQQPAQIEEQTQEQINEQNTSMQATGAVEPGEASPAENVQVVLPDSNDKQQKPTNAVANADAITLQQVNQGTTESTSRQSQSGSEVQGASSAPSTPSTSSASSASSASSTSSTSSDTSSSPAASAADSTSTAAASDSTLSAAPGGQALTGAWMGQAAASVDYPLAAGINVIRAGTQHATFTIDPGKVVMLVGAGEGEAPIVFSDCTFAVSGDTQRLSEDLGVSYNIGETLTKLWIGRDIRFENCTFTVEKGSSITTDGPDAALYFYTGNVVMDHCTLRGTGFAGQFLGQYASSNLTFQNSTISTDGNCGSWSYALYGQSVMNLENSYLGATHMTKKNDNINAFYAGDSRTRYDAVNLKGSTVDFSDNDGGGFALNNVNIYLDNTRVSVKDNAGNACNGGTWYLSNQSVVAMDGNRGHGLSCIGVKAEDSTLELLHNGYAGLFIQSADSSFTNSNVTAQCNGERIKKYSAGDVWLNNRTATFIRCPQVWLGGVSTADVGRTGVVRNQGCASFVAYDLTQVIGRASVMEAGLPLSAQEGHTLFLSGSCACPYARAVSPQSQDADLMETETAAAVTGKASAKIGTLTTAQLSHHSYDWANGEVTSSATEAAFGVVRYPCTLCGARTDWAQGHPNGFGCAGAYVYGPLVGLCFDGNAAGDTVSGVPQTQAQLGYGTAAAAPEAAPTRSNGSSAYTYRFTGWYTDPACTAKYDFSQPLTANWTVVYAGWCKELTPTPTPTATATPTAAPTATPAPTTAPTAAPTEKAATATPKPTLVAVAATPKTGDASHPLGWAAALAASMAGLAAFGAAWQKKRGHKQR